jgi:hypothetical protein
MGAAFDRLAVNLIAGQSEPAEAEGITLAKED